MPVIVKASRRRPTRSRRSSAESTRCGFPTTALIGVTTLGELDETYVARDNNHAGGVTTFPVLEVDDETQP
jgi:hypothetical protein